MYQDTHIHVQDIKSPAAVRDFLEQGKIFGLRRVLNCAITPADWPVIRSLPQEHADVVPFFGFHPWFADLADTSSMNKLEEYLALPGTFAGEMGLDKARKNVDLGLQKEVFAAQLVLAKRFDKPFAVHCVRAWADTISLIREHAPGLRFLMHSFNGSSEIAQEIISLGGFFSVSVKEFTRPEMPLRDVFKALPRERILLETDFPYQIKWTSPRDYMAAVRLGYETAAAWRGVPVDEFIKDVYDNGTVFTHGTSSRG